MAIDIENIKEHALNIVATGFSAFLIGALYTLSATSMAGNTITDMTFALQLAVTGGLYYAAKMVLEQLVTITGIAKPTGPLVNATAAAPNAQTTAAPAPVPVKKSFTRRML